MDDIVLRRVQDPQPEKSQLPHGVHAVIVGGQVFFVRRIAGRFVQLPSEEQERLRKKHVV